MKCVPFFSIIVPIYNADKSIQCCVQSLLNQSFKDFELILINDGSNDRTEEICRYYSSLDARVRLYSQENKGVSAARNLGLSKCSGTWVTFCDADDYVDCDWLSCFAKCITESTEMVVQEFIPVGDYANTLVNCSIHEGIHDTVFSIDDLIENKCLGYLWTKCFRMSTIAQNYLTFDEDVSLKEDELFVLEYYKYIQTVSHGSEKHYFYTVPDYRVKYSDSKEYQVLLKEYSLANDISIHSTFTDVFFHRLTNMLFDGYAKKRWVDCEPLRLYRLQVSCRTVFRSDLSIASKLSFLLPCEFAHYLLLIKAGVRKSLGTSPFLV